MKNILILKGDRPEQPGTASFVLQKGLAESENNYSLERYSNIVFIIKNNEVSCYSAVTGRDLASYDLVYLRDIVYEEVRHAISLYLSFKKIPVVNTEASNFQCISKLTQNISFALNGIPVPDSVYAQSDHREGAIDASGLSYPFIAKAIKGSNGRDNFLIESKGDLPEEIMGMDLILQPFIPNTFDYRIVVGGDEVLIAYKRIRNPKSSTHQNNISQGGTGEIVNDLPKDVQEIALKAAKSINRELCGVDVLKNSKTGDHVVLEANFNFATPPFSKDVLEFYYMKLDKYLSSLAGS